MRKRSCGNETEERDKADGTGAFEAVAPTARDERILIILLVVAIVAIVNPKFIQPSNMKSIALSVATDGLLSIGLTLGSDSGRH